VNSNASAHPTLDRITVDPLLLHGQATIRGLRIGVAQVVNMLANGMSHEEVLRELPLLDEEDIRQCLRYAALLTADEIRPLEPAPA
jgi:uncharacterized protein (DUF433 family)